MATKAPTATYGKDFITPPVEVFWSSLQTPDTKFGNPNHSVTVIVDNGLNVMLTDAMKQLQGKKINSLREFDNKKLMKFKNSLICKNGTKEFPVLGVDRQPSTTIPFRSDLVRVKVTPVLLHRDNSVSFYLKEIQLIERRYQDTTEVAF